MPYDISEHKHRFSAWAASRAASTKTCRFDVQTGKRILEEIGLKEFVHAPDKLPEPHEIDATHEKWRKLAIESAANQGLHFTHGIAAKIINCYLKAGLVCGGFESHPKVTALHPPIDSLLLDELFEGKVGGSETTKVWATTRRIRWSKMNSTEYQAVINAIKAVMENQPLWNAERYWRGFQ